MQIDEIAYVRISYFVNLHYHFPHYSSLNRVKSVPGNDGGPSW
jgi:hypothetical protein